MPIFTHNVIELANLAGCGQPDSTDTDGAEFLIAVMDAVEDAIDNDDANEDTLTDIANDAPSGVIATRWRQFTDLAGWRIDTTDLTGDRISARQLSDHANTVLVVIAENLIAALMNERLEAVQRYVENTDGE